MSSYRSDDLIAYARELEQRDSEIAARIEHANELLRRVDDVRGSAERLRLALAEAPVEIALTEKTLADAQARETDARRELLEAEKMFEGAQSSKRARDDAKTVAERALRRARVLAVDAADGVARQRERLRLLESDQVTLRADAEGLAVEARAVRDDVVTLPRLSESGRTASGTSLEQIVEWGARVHSAIFVVRGGLESERERIVHEASALASSALGEQVAGANVAIVRRRLEQELGRS